jgi:uncharacterized protein YcgL (UPF0745 family)
MTDELTCWVYRSSRKDEMYLYLADKDVFDPVPEALLKAMGRLAREDVNQVLANLRDQSFHLQMPPRLTPVSLPGRVMAGSSN